MTYQYHVYGLNISSEFELPRLKNRNFVSDAPSVSITPGKLTPLSKEWFHSHNRGTLELQIQNIAKFYIKDKNTIIVDPNESAGISDIQTYLLGSALGAILYLNQRFVLHACCVNIEGQATAFCGWSGIGKSSIATACQREKLQVLSDDVTPLEFTKDNILAYPGYPSVKLWRECAYHLNKDITGAEKVSADCDKYVFPLEHHITNPIPLKKIVHIQVDDIDEIEMIQLNQLEKIALLKSNSYRYCFLQGLGLLEKHFQQACTLAKQLDIELIKRPKELPMDQFHAYLFQHILKKEKEICYS